jgi:hypothetical protein
LPPPLPGWTRPRITAGIIARLRATGTRARAARTPRGITATARGATLATPAVTRPERAAVIRFESRHSPLLPFGRFLRRVLGSFSLMVALVGVALSIGVAGYHWIGGLAWIDALLNASMILGGMGPVDPLRSDAAKVFASIYALFSGVVFISSIGVFVAPIVHRFLHRFHLGEPERGARG